MAAALSAGAQAEQGRELRIESLEAMPGPVAAVSYIVGSATNVSGKLIGDAFVKFNLYDRDKAVVGHTVDKVSNLKAGQTWQIKAGAIVPFDHFELTEVTAYTK